MNNALIDQQMNNNNKAKQKTQEQLSSPLSQVRKTYDFGNFENCELIMKLFDLSLTSHPHLYHKSRNLHKWICSPM